MSKKDGTYLIKFTDGTQVVVGNNYKPWYLHATEFAYGKYRNKEGSTKKTDVIKMLQQVDHSHSPFIDDGGLKWAGYPDAYQKVRNDVAAKEPMEFTPLDQVPFAYSSSDTRKLIRELERY
jgi:hypothetical protein